MNVVGCVMASGYEAAVTSSARPDLLRQSAWPCTQLHDSGDAASEGSEQMIISHMSGGAEMADVSSNSSIPFDSRMRYIGIK